MDAPPTSKPRNGLHSLSESDINNMLLVAVWRLIPWTSRLPRELADLVASFIPRSDILTLVLVDRAICDHLMPMIREKMYRTVSLQYSRPSLRSMEEAGRRMVGFLSTILRKPELGQNVRRFEVDILDARPIDSRAPRLPAFRNPQIPHLSVADYELATPLLKTLFPDDEKYPAHFTRYAHFEDLIAFAITQLSRLETLAISPDIDYMSNHLQTFLERRLVSMESLRIIDLTYRSVNPGRSISPYQSDEPIQFWLYAPNLEELMLSALTNSDSEYIDEESTPFLTRFWPNPPVAKQLTKLVVHRSRMLEKEFGLILSCCPSLTELFLHHECIYPTRERVDAQQLKEALNHISGTLENLHLAVGFVSYRTPEEELKRYGRQCLSGSIGSLESFSHLRDLTISPLLLFGWDVTDQLALASVLPKSLFNLRLVEDVSYMKGFQWDETAVGRLIGDFLHDQKLHETFPNFDELSVETSDDGASKVGNRLTDDMIVCSKCEDKKRGTRRCSTG